MSDFKYDCELSDNCTYTDYEEYDGYALVIAFFDGKTSFLTQWGFCVPDKQCVVVDPINEYFTYHQLDMTSTFISETTPAYSVWQQETWDEC